MVGGCGGGGVGGAAGGLPHVRKLRKVRLALGLHPLAAAEHSDELADFEAYFTTTSFIGEVGLDYSREGRDTKQRQMKSFRFVARLLSMMPKVVSLHSRGAEEDVLMVLDEFDVKSTIFHWYSGPLKTLDDVINAGHLLSVNPAMTRSTKGREIIARIPRTQILSETDGPYVQIGCAPAKPWDAAPVEKHLAQLWFVTVDQARAQLWSNFVALIDRVRQGRR
jgi:TatD DNase family protein